MSKITVSAFGCNHGHLVDFSKIPVSDVCCILGDIMPVYDHHVAFQESWFKNNFIPWFKDIPANYKVVIGGNHDFWLQSKTQEEIQSLLPKNCYYLWDDKIVILGKTFFGTPWVSGLGRWAFNREPGEIFSILDSKIPENLDVFMSHSAPKIGNIGVSLDIKGMIRDPKTGLYNKQCPDFGNEAIADIIYKYKPKLNISSHIHSGDHQGIFVNNGISFVVNCAYLGENYTPKYKIRQFEI